MLGCPEISHVGLAASLPPLTPCPLPTARLAAHDAEALVDPDRNAPFDPTEPGPIPNFEFYDSLGA